MKAKITKLNSDHEGYFEVEMRVIDSTGDDLNFEQLGGFEDDWVDPEIITDPAEFGGEWIVSVQHCRLMVGDIITDGLEPELGSTRKAASTIDRGEDYYHARALNAAQAADKFDALRHRGPK